jgi:YD repeat-containing protein
VLRFALVLFLVALALVPGSSAAVRVDATSCSVDFRARNANLDCALAIPGGAVTLAGSLVISADVRGDERAAFTYDGLGRLLAADVGGAQTSYRYGDDGRLTAASGPGGLVSYAYDSLGRLVAAGDARLACGDLGLTRAVGADGSTVDYSYDSAGNLITADAGTSSARFAYDAHGRLTGAAVDGSTTAYRYSGSLPVLRVTDGETTQYTYDGQRRLVRSSGGDTVSYSYDTDGSLRAVADSAGVTRFTYDRGGRLLGIAEPDGVATAFAYNEAGFLSLVVPGTGAEVIVDFEEGTPGQPLIFDAVYTDSRGRSFSLSPRGRLATCSTCP